MRQSKIIKSQPKTNLAKQTPIQTNHLSQSLVLNQQYFHLLKQLANIVFISTKSSSKAELFQTIQLLKQIKQCLKKQSNYYTKTNENKLSNFVENKQLGNAGNLIGRYQEFNDQIQYCKKKLQQAEVKPAQVQLQELSQMEQKLEKQLEQVTKKRMQLQNRQQAIRQQLQICQMDFQNGKCVLFKQQLKLRGLENSKIKF